jgi:hypothetical protein
MTETVVGVIVALAVVSALVFRVAKMRAHHDLHFGPHLHSRVMRILEPYEGNQLPIGRLRELQRAAQETFDDTLTGVGLVPTGWRIELDCDDLLGPVAHVIGPDKQRFPLAEFEARLRDGRIALEAA